MIKKRLFLRYIIKTLYLCTRKQKQGLFRKVAQLVAHYVRDVGVGRSSRLFPTRKRRIYIRRFLVLVMV